MPNLVSEFAPPHAIQISQQDYADLWETVGQLLKDMRKIEMREVPTRNIRKFAGESIRKAEMVYPITPIPG